MTTPGGVSNLPPGALTVENMESQLQDTSLPAVRGRAADRVPALFNNSNGGNPASDGTPFGILTKFFASFSSTVANADPADIQGPEDLPDLLKAFVESLPVIGQFVGLLDAILGTYEGDDEILLAIQQIFEPIRRVLQLITGQDVDFPSLEDIEDGWDSLFTAIHNNVQAFKDKLTGYVNSTDTELDNWLLSLLTGDFIPASSITTKTMNLQRNHNFLSGSVLSGEKQGNWSLDSTWRKGSLGNGLKVVGGGNNWIALPKIRVSQKQAVDVTAHAQWSMVTGASAKIAVYVKPIGGADVGWQLLESRTVTGTETTSWIVFDGDYTIVDEDVDYVEVVLAFIDATGGAVCFSDLDVVKPVAPGTIPGVMIDGLADGLDALGEFAQTIGMTIMKVLTGLPFIGWIFDDLEEALADFFDDTQNTAGRADDAWGWMKDTWDALMQGWRSTSETGFTYADILGEAAAQALEISHMQAGIAQLQKDAAAQYNSGKTYTVAAMTNTGPGLPATLVKISDTGAGSVIDAGNVFCFDLNVDGRELFLFNGGALATDYFEISAIVTKWGIDYLGSSGQNKIYLLGRVSATGDEFVVLEMSRTTTRVGAVKPGGAYASIATPYWFGPAVNVDVSNYVTYRGGTNGGERYFQVLVDNQVEANFHDSSAFSNFGPTLRNWGWGLGSDHQDPVSRSPNISHVIANDNAPPPLVGTQGRVYRSLTSNSSNAPGSTPDRTMPNDAFDFIEYISDDILFDTTKCEWTLLPAAPIGAYVLEWSYYVSSAAVSQTVSHTAYLNGGIKKRGGEIRWDSTTQRRFGESFMLNLKPGDKVKPGQSFSSTQNITVSGDAAGIETWCELVYVGPMRRAAA